MRQRIDYERLRDLPPPGAQPSNCRFISEAVYDGRLFPAEMNPHQRLVLRARLHTALRPTGVVFWPMEHTGCGQKSPEEADEIQRNYQSLPKQSWIDRSGKKRRITPDDILVVTSYNLQVNLLKRVLPDTARVGTVDKFPGAGGGGVADLDDDFERDRPAPPPRVPLQQEPAERCYL